MTMKNFPTVGQVLQRKTAAAKTAEDMNSAAEGCGNLSVPEGDTMATAATKPKELMGEGGVDPSDTAVQDTEPATVNTDVGKSGSETISASPAATIPDPGPDSSHPASPSEEKYSSCESAQDVLNVLLGELDLMAKEAAAMTPAKQKPVTRVEKVASILEDLVPADGTNNLRDAYNAKVAAFAQPYVHAGIERADRLAQFIKLAEVDPAAAAEMMGQDPAAMGGDPAMMGGDPAAMGGDPAAMGGDPAMMGGDPGAGGEVDDEQLMALIEQVAAESGVSPEELLEALAAELQGQGMGGEQAMAPEAAPEMAPEASPEMAPEAAPLPEEAKAASAPGGASQVATARKKIAQLLASEVGKTPKQVAQGC